MKEKQKEKMKSEHETKTGIYNREQRNEHGYEWYSELWKNLESNFDLDDLREEGIKTTWKSDRNFFVTANDFSCEIFVLIWLFVWCVLQIIWFR